MEQLKGIKLKQLGFELTKRGDLISLNSPLLSHFFDEESNNYLLYWLDTNDEVNRWLLFEIDYLDLYDYFTLKKSLRNLIKGGEEIVYFIDIDNNIEYKSIIISTKSEIPLNYIPEKDSFYDEFISTSYSKKLKEEVVDVYSKYRLKNIKTKVRNFNTHIDDLNFINELNQRNISNSFEEIKHLKSSYLPLLILNEHLGDNKSRGIKHLLYKHNSAYTNPFVLDTYFHELSSILSNKVDNNFICSNNDLGIKFRFGNEHKNTLNKLYYATIFLISQDPNKYKNEIHLWKNSLENDEDEDKVNSWLDEILSK